MAPRARRMSTRSTPANTNWGRLVLAKVGVAAGTKTLVGSFILDNPGISETVRRTRGRFMFTSDQATIQEVGTPVWGMIVVTDVALAAGAASIPGPLTDASDDGWFVWESAPQSHWMTDASAAGIPGPQTFEFDSKAMRKVATGYAIAIMAEVLVIGVEFNLGVSLLSSRN